MSQNGETEIYLVIQDIPYDFHYDKEKAYQKFPESGIGSVSLILMSSPFNDGHYDYTGQTRYLEKL